MLYRLLIRGGDTELFREENGGIWGCGEFVRMWRKGVVSGDVSYEVLK